MVVPTLKLAAIMAMGALVGLAFAFDGGFPILACALLGAGLTGGVFLYDEGRSAR